MKCEGVFLTFDTDARGQVKNPRPSQPHLAMRFTRADASLVAAAIKNGNGTAGTVLHVRDAIEEALAAQRDLHSLLKSHQDCAAQQRFDMAK